MWLMYTVKIHVTGIQYSESQFLRLYSIYEGGGGGSVVSDSL